MYLLCVSIQGIYVELQATKVDPSPYKVRLSYGRQLTRVTPRTDSYGTRKDDDAMNGHCRGN